MSNEKCPPCNDSGFIVEETAGEKTCLDCNGWFVAAGTRSDMGGSGLGGAEYDCTACGNSGTVPETRKIQCLKCSGTGIKDDY